jgi:hypothetical protein
MDWWNILMAGGIMVVVDVSIHFIISDREFRQLKAESARFEAKWQAFLKEVNEAVEKRKQ